MTNQKTQHIFANDKGEAQIEIPVKKFQCIGASPPHDHPHIYLDMGDKTQITCPYCGTLYIYQPNETPLPQ